MEDLKYLKRLIFELNGTNSSTEKKKILKNYPECKKILYYTYNPFLQYYVTSDSLKKHSNLCDPVCKYKDFFILLEDLSSRKITGYQAISTVNSFISNNKPYADIILRVLDKNLKTRIDVKTINSVFPGLIPVFNVQLAERYEDYSREVDFEESTWFASRKIDGVRVITIANNKDDIKFYSRKGKEFFTLEKVKREISKIFNEINGGEGFVLDGEMCILNDKGIEDFISIVEKIRRKDFTIENLKYKIFDLLQLETFYNPERSKKNRLFSERLNIIEELEREKIFDKNLLDPVEQIKIKDKEHLDYLIEEANGFGWEGLIIRKDVLYEGKRTKNLLKIKKFLDDEYVVKDVVMGKIRFIEDNREKEEEMLSAIIIEHKGNNVSVGSGFSIDFRRKAFKDPSILLGKTVTVAYFEETKNKQGLISLRFPTVKAIYDKREI